MRYLKVLVFVSTFSLWLFISCAPRTEKSLQYPVTRTVDHTDTYHEVKVADPYRWLEDDPSEEVNQWVDEQNKVTQQHLSSIPFRDKIHDRLEELWNYERLTAPFQAGDYYYFYRNAGLENQSILYRVKDFSDEPELFVDPNTFSEAGTTSLAGISFDKTGRYAALSISESGSDWRRLEVWDATSKQAQGDELQDLKFSNVAWRGTEGFYYSKYDDSSESDALSSEVRHHGLYFHTLGTPQEQDELIFGGKERPTQYVGGEVTEDERFLIIYASQLTYGNALYVQDLTQADAPLVPVVEHYDNEHGVLDNEGDDLLIHTNLDATNRKVVRATYPNLTPEYWTDVIPETEHAMYANTAAGYIFAHYTVDVTSSVKQFTYEGTLVTDVELPGLGTTGGFYGKKKAKWVFYTYTSLTIPTRVYRYDPNTYTSSIHNEPALPFDPNDYESERQFFNSPDGTKIPIFIMYKKGFQKNGNAPTLLYGYGGFNISIRPRFNPSHIYWIENGGLYAQANIRGGSEYGDQWHDAGTRTNKQKVFDDFIAAAEYLIKEKYTSAQHLAIEGRSNGGLLVGACITQRPDLYRVALPAVGVMDMLRYNAFTVGSAWSYDFGTPQESKEMFEYIYAYSPLHNLKEGISYPATLVTTADHDDRVVPAHSYKFIATLQAKHKGTKPVLIRIDTKAGHGAGKSTKQRIAETADQYAFAWYHIQN